jgi:hypothetical protein
MKLFNEQLYFWAEFLARGGYTRQRAVYGSFQWAFLCIIITLFKEYFDLRGKKKRDNGESCTMGSFTICTHRQILLGRSNQGEWGGRVIWHTWERGEKCIVFFGGEARRKDPLARPRRRWKDEIGTDLWEIGWGGVKWIRLAQVRDWWRALVNSVMNLRVLAPRI